MKNQVYAYQSPRVVRAVLDTEPFKNRYAASYAFSANLVDVASIPSMSTTVVHVSRNPVSDDKPPWIWRAAMEDNKRIIEVESVSDAKTLSMVDEAKASWRGFVDEVKKRANWMKLIGVHEDIQRRMSCPHQLYAVRIVTVCDDFLERLYAEGNAEMVRMACLLKDILDNDMAIDLGRVTFENFFWPTAEDCQDEFQYRYEQALRNKEWHATSESIYAPN